MNISASTRFASALSASLENSQRPNILAIGDLGLWRRSFGTLPVHAGVRFSDLDDVDSAFLELLQPDLVVSPVVTPVFDCIDVAFRIASADFRGAYRAIARNLPNPDMVRREVRAACPDLDFNIVQLLDDGVIRG